MPGLNLPFLGGGGGFGTIGYCEACGTPKNAGIISAALAGGLTFTIGAVAWLLSGKQFNLAWVIAIAAVIGVIGGVSSWFTCKGVKSGIPSHVTF